jgi:hypothetical protein
VAFDLGEDSEVSAKANIVTRVHNGAKLPDDYIAWDDMLAAKLLNAATLSG